MGPSAPCRSPGSVRVSLVDISLEEISEGEEGKHGQGEPDGNRGPGRSERRADDRLRAARGHPRRARALLERELRPDLSHAGRARAAGTREPARLEAHGCFRLLPHPVGESAPEGAPGPADPTGAASQRSDAAAVFRASPRCASLPVVGAPGEGRGEGPACALRGTATRARCGTGVREGPPVLAAHDLSGGARRPRNHRLGGRGPHRPRKDRHEEGRKEPEMTSTTRIDLENTGSKRRARINFAIFAAVAITIGWVGIALDEATGQPATNSLGMGLWFAAPLLVAIVLHRLRPDGAGTLGLTLRFRGRARWFALAAILYPVATTLIVLPAIASGVGVFDASGSDGSSTLILAMVAVVPGMAI